MDSSHADTNSPPSLPRLFVSFLRLGTTAFGGPAMVAYIRKMAVEQNQWLDEATFQDGVALCQTIPGATAMQTAAYVGLRAAGSQGPQSASWASAYRHFVSWRSSRPFMPAHTICPWCWQPSRAPRHDGGHCRQCGPHVREAVFTGLADIIVAALAAAMFALKVNPIVVILLAALVGLVLYRGQTRSMPQATDESPLPVRSRWRMTPLFLVVAAGFALLFMANRGLFDLAALMFRIDLFAFGGGFASVPLMYHEIVDVRSWMNGETFMNGIALGQVTPGPIVITATFVGYCCTASRERSLPP